MKLGGGDLTNLTLRPCSRASQASIPPSWVRSRMVNVSVLAFTRTPSRRALQYPCRKVEYERTTPSSARLVSCSPVLSKTIPPPWLHGYCLSNQNPSSIVSRTGEPDSPTGKARDRLGS